MADSRLEKFARVLVEYSLEVTAGDRMRIRGEVTAEPLMREVYRLAVRKGAYPFFDLALPGLAEIFLKEAPEEALDYLSPRVMFDTENIDVDLVIMADSNTHALAGVAPARLARMQRARRPQIERWSARAFGDPMELRWCATLFPTNALAQDGHMSLADYEDFVYRGMLLDTEDPVAAWRAQSALQQRYCNCLQSADEMRIEADGTDLRFRVGGRKWINADGQRNFPDGEVFTGPIEDSVNGTIRYTFPTVFQGREAEDVRLTWENGVVTHWDAHRGVELLHELLGLDDGARRLGEFAIGTNYAIPAFTKNILFDEKIGGTCHLAVGSSIASTGGVNKSALHWDMVCDLRQGGRIYADGQVIHENGVWRL